MPDRLNRLRNPEFAEGARRPVGWTWCADSDSVTWMRGGRGEESVAGERPPDGVLLTSLDEGASGYFTQRVRCKAEQWYRVEVVVSCACTTDDDDAGAVLRVRPHVDGAESDAACIAVVSRSTEPETMRGCYRTPPGARWLEIGIGIVKTQGQVRVHSALVIPNIKPEITSNPLALPPPPYAYPAPRKVRRVCVCDESGERRPLVALLRKRFGAGAVEHRRTRGLRLRDVTADALIVAGPRPPTVLRSLAALARAGADRMVILSLDAFADAADCGLRIRDVKQPDDPTLAKVVWANFITRGFALHDCCPWSSPAVDSRVYRQRHIRRSRGVNQLRRQHGYETVLVSVTDADATSDHPICLHKAVDGGGVIVLDVDAVETPPTTRDESGPAAFVLLNALGADQASLGQYTVPTDTEGRWYDLLSEFAQRYPPVRLSGRDRHDMMLEVGVREEMLGLPTTSRPVLLIRSGLRGDDVAGMYGCMAYLKQLVRSQPHSNPYARALLAAFRLAWVPLCAPYQPHYASPAPGPDNPEITGAFERGSIAAVIDVTDAPRHALRVVYDREHAAYARHARLLPELAERFRAGRYFYRAVEEGQPTSRRDTAGWRRERLIPDVCVDADAFPTELHRCAADAGANLVRIELPGSVRDFVCHSIWRTDLAATTLEHVIGVHYGLLAVNRGSSRMIYDGHTPLNPGQGIIERDGEVLGKQVG